MRGWTTLGRGGGDDYKVVLEVKGVFPKQPELKEIWKEGCLSRGRMGEQGKRNGKKKPAEKPGPGLAI